MDIQNKKPLLWIEKGRGQTTGSGTSNKFPFSKEGGAVSGDTHRLYAMRIFPW